MTDDYIRILNEQPYRIKIMGCLILAELIMLAVFLFWPVEQKKSDMFQDINTVEDAITMENVQITTQRSSPPPPPSPQVPVPVPNDQIIEEEPIVMEELDFQNLPNPIDETGRGPGGNSNQIAANPDQSPSLVRIVEPTVPEAAKKKDIKAEIWVSFLVNTEGNVEEASISEIRIYENNGQSYKTVNHINYGLTEATIEAALRWKFRPARKDGQPVKAFTEHVFSFGF